MLIVRRYVNGIRDGDVGDTYQCVQDEMERLLDGWKREWNNVQLRDDNLEQPDKVLVAAQLVAHLDEIAIVSVSYALMSGWVFVQLRKCDMDRGSSRVISVLKASV
jgi:hypothetical protein